MTQFQYEAVDKNRHIVTGKFAASNKKQLATELSKQGLYLLTAKIYTGATPSAFFTTGTGKVELSELTMFCRQFAIMSSSGVAIVDILDTLKLRNFSSYFKQILTIICDDIKSGSMFSQAVEKHKKVFPDIFCSMIQVAEHSGKLSQVFIDMADYFETESKSRQKLKSALSYPIMLIFLILAVLILMLAYVVPTFRDSLSSLNVEPEGITLTVYNVSDFLLANWLYILAIVSVLACGLFIFGLTDKGKFCYGYLNVRLPFIKEINIDMLSSRFARCFSLLLNSGMDTGDALDVVRNTLVNREVMSRFDKAVSEIKQGMSMSDAFRIFKIFPPIMIQMIQVGEKTGKLAEVLHKSCDFFDDQAERSINSFSSKIQPTMLIILGCVVAVLFIAIYSPMLSIMNSF